MLSDDPSIAVACRGVAAIRSQPRDDAEMISQALFGEPLVVLDRAGDHVRVRAADRYEGWMRPEHLEALPELIPAAGTWQVATLLEPLLSEPDRTATRRLLLPLGSTVRTDEPPLRPYAAVVLGATRVGYVQTSALQRAPSPERARDAANLVQAAARYIGVPYQWGGRSPFGIDCSGLTQMAYRLCGITIPRDAYLQAASKSFEPVERTRLARGDLVFFCGPADPHSRGITHVGLVDEPPRFIHAAGRSGVTWGDLNEPPYADEYRCARRLKASLRT